MPPELTSAELDNRQRRALTRDISERQARTADNEGFIGTLAGVALVTAGAYLVGRHVVRHDSVLRATDRLGRRAHKVLSPLRDVYRGWMDEVVASNVSSPYAKRIENLELTERIAESMAVMAQAKAGGVEQAHMQVMLGEIRESMVRRGFEQQERAGLGALRPATVADVMDVGRVGEALRGEVGETAFNVIKEGYQAGVVGGSTTLTRGYGGVFIDKAARAGQHVVDARFLKPSNVLSALGNAGRGIQVPFIGFRPADLIAGLMRPFGEGHHAGQVGRNLELAKGVRTGSGMNFVIGGNLLRQTAKGGFEVVEANLRLGKMGAVGELGHLTRYGAGKGYHGQALNEKLRKGEGNMGDHAQNVLGIGPAFKTRDPAWKSLWNIARRRNEGEYYRHEYVSLRSHAGYQEKAQAYREAWASGADPEVVLSGAVPNTKPMTRVDKVLANTGLSRKFSVVRKGMDPSKVQAEDVIAGQMDDVGRLGGRRVAVPGEPVPPGYMGKMADPLTTPIEFYAYGGKAGGFKNWVQGQTEAMIDIGHYMTNRLNDLFSLTAGVGFRPSEGKGIAGGLFGLGKNVAKIKGLFLGVSAGMEGVKYADYLFESTIGQVLPKNWDSPSDLLIQAYRGFRYLQTGVRHATGIQQSAEYMEDLMPGSMDSGLSTVLRTAAPVVRGLIKGGKGALQAGMVGAAVFGGTEPGKHIKDLHAEFQGEKQVAVRKSRWWMLGRQPFEGGQIDYYKPHWTVEEQSDYKYTDVLYGSKAEYWGNVSRLPNLHNFLGLKMLFQDGGIFGGGDVHLAKKHRLARPYPDTPGIDKGKAEAMAQFIAARGPYDAPFGAGQRLGYGTAGTNAQPLSKYGGMLGAITKQTEELSELTGIYKFLMWDLPGFGETNASPKLASAETMDSTARHFYDRGLGGLLGMTEAYRRFVRPDEARQGTNPIPNTIPDWLPGLRSVFPGDRQYHIDFTLGDPYAKIGKGEMRLPGAGYDELHRLHSGSAGVYDPMDRFLILADVAPHSEAYKHYRVIVESWRNSGVLDAYWGDKFDTAKEQVKSKMERYQYYHRRFTGLITDPDPKLTEDKYNVVEKALGGVYETFAHDLVPKAGDVVPILGPMVADKLFAIRSPIEHYKRFQVYGEEFADWRSPYKAFIRPKANWLASQDPLTATAGGAALSLFGSNPMAAIGLGIAGAAGFGAASTIRTMGTGRLEGGYVPGFRQRERELTQYFDALEYTKAKMMESRSLAVGDTELAYHYSKQWKRTGFGVDYSQSDLNTFTAQAMRAMPRNERAYMLSFMEMPATSQDHVMDYMAPEQAAMLAKASGRWNEPKFGTYRTMMGNGPDQRVSSYFASIGGAPNSDWGGWHPDVPMDAIKIKMADTGWNSTSSDIHRYDLFSEHRFRASRFQNLEVPIPTGRLSESRVDMSGMSLVQNLQDAGFDNVQFRYGIGGPEDTIHWDAKNNNWPNIRGMVESLLR